MTVKGALVFCNCGHAVDDHRSNGPCRRRDSYGFPCECHAVEVVGEEDEDGEELPAPMEEYVGPHIRESWEKPLPEPDPEDEKPDVDLSLEV